jgi:outer membrane lipoprotein SlyB
MLTRVLFASMAIAFATSLGLPSVALAQHPSEGGMSSPPPSTGCGDCGVVQSVRAVEQKGQSSGAGAVIGGVAGGVLGHQIGSGRGNTVATIAGVGVGALAGNEVEKQAKKTTSWNVVIRMDNGATRSFNYSAEPSVREGDRVKLVDNGRRLALVAN